MNHIFSLFVLLLQQLPISINHRVLIIYVFLSSFTYMDLLYWHLIVHFNVEHLNTVQSLQLFRSLHLLSLNDTKMQSSLAQMIIHTLLESSCDLHTLEISENNVGWHEKKSILYFLLYIFYPLSWLFLVDCWLAVETEQKFYKLISTEIRYFYELPVRS